MANFVDYSYSSDSGDSDYTGKPQCLDFSYAGLNNITLTNNLEAIACQDGSSMKTADYYESMVLKHNRLTVFPDSAAFFINLKIIDLSGNSLNHIPDFVVELQNLTSLIVKNNLLVDDGIPKNLGLCKSLKEVNFSGNCLTRFPDHILELDHLKFLYIGSNQIPSIPSTIGRLQK